MLGPAAEAHTADLVLHRHTLDWKYTHTTHAHTQLWKLAKLPHHRKSLESVRVCFHLNLKWSAAFNTAAWWFHTQRCIVATVMWWPRVKWNGPKLVWTLFQLNWQQKKADFKPIWSCNSVVVSVSKARPMLNIHIAFGLGETDQSLWLHLDLFFLLEAHVCVFSFASSCLSSAFITLTYCSQCAGFSSCTQGECGRWTACCSGGG